MAYREVTMTQVKEVLRLWVMGKGWRAIARLADVDRKTARRYVEAGQRAGVRRDAGEAALTDEVLAAVAEAVRPKGPGERGEGWKHCEAHREQLEKWLEADLRLTKIHTLLTRHTGRAVAYRTLHRYATEELGFGRRRVTVRVDDGKPGEELQLDFGQLGRLAVVADGPLKKVWALIFTAVCSRHQFGWLTFEQSLESVVEGFERAWEFFGGIFRVIIPDNFKAIVTRADPISPRLNDRFVHYAQARGFVIDPARVRHPDDKPRVERAVPYLRDSFFAGEEFRDRVEAQKRLEDWCLTTAGLRVHGTLQRRPLECFELTERPALLPLPEERYELPVVVSATVQPDHHLRVGKSLYSLPSAYIGQKVEAWATSQLVRIYLAGKLIKLHKRVGPGERATDPADYPPGKAIYATRDTASLQKLAEEAGSAVGVYAVRLLEGPLPWTRMRQVYRLLALVRRYGAQRVEQACRQALELDVVDVTRVSRMLEKALEARPPETLVMAPKPANVVPLRFARETSEFAVSGLKPALMAKAGGQK